MKSIRIFVMTLCVAVPFIWGAAEVSASEKEKLSFSDRVALRTNALEWMFVIPNFGVEYRIGANPYRYMTLGLTGKYNWNTSHVSGSGSAYSPSMVYDLLDIRPEYRYYFRLREGKNAKAWQALYTGAYANYADYIFKLGKYGLRGHNTFGFGTMFGCVLPLYEYDKGAVDIDFGFSLGVQFARHDAFTHEMDGDYYVKLAPGNKYFSMTQSSRRILPYPVISEVRVAFVWRKESMRYHVKTDFDAIEEEKKLERNIALVMDDLDNIMPVKFKYRFDNENREEVRRWKQNDSLYRARFAEAVKSQKEDMLIQVNDPFKAFGKKELKKLLRMVEKRERQIFREFGKLWAEEKRRKR